MVICRDFHTGRTIGSVGDQSFLAAAAEQAPTLPGATSGCSLAQVVAPQDQDDDQPALQRPQRLSAPQVAPDPCSRPSAVVRTVIGLYRAAFMGSLLYRACLACCFQQRVASLRVARIWSEDHSSFTTTNHRANMFHHVEFLSLATILIL